VKSTIGHQQHHHPHYNSMTDVIYVHVEPSSTTSSTSKGRRLIGALSLFGLVASWVAQAEVAQ
jgi:hypothetical protein